MKRGINILVLSLGAWAFPAFAGDGTTPLAAASDTLQVGATTAEAWPVSPVSPATVASLKKEAYYHFFLEDYLTSATRLKLMEKGVQNEPSLLNETRLLRGSLYLAWGLHRSARTIFDQLVATFPPGNDRNQVLLLIERLQYSRSLYEAAVSTYKRLDRDPTFASLDQAAYFAGMSHYALGQFDESLRAFATVPTSSAYRPFAALASAKSRMQLADVSAAIRLLEGAGAFTPEDDAERQALAEKSRVTLGLLFTETGWYDNAVPTLASVPSSSRFYPDATFGLGWAHLYRKRYNESLAAFLALVRAAPDHPYALEALTTIGHCYDRLGQHAKALESYVTALDTYQRTQQNLLAIKSLIRDRDQLDALFTDFHAVMRSPLAPILEDDGLRYWVKQYGELAALEHYLARKLEDTAVFDVMLEHRQAIFRERVPIVQGFLDESPVAPLTQREAVLQTAIEQAVRHETARNWASGAERPALDELEDARRKSRAVGESIRRMDDGTPAVRDRLHDLRAQWQTTDRWLDVLYGERVWTIATDVPGRRDDLQRALNRLHEDLEQADRDQRKLVESIAGIENRLGTFRSDIRDIRRDLVAHQRRLTAARAELLPPLQALLVKAVDQRHGRIETMAAAARLNQIRLWDMASQ
ncbi:MAG: tetratricopeptide repeat protein [Nitrospirota bacterium]